MRRLISALALLAAAATPLALAQTPPDPPLERGFHADSSFHIGDIDHIDLSRGSLQLMIPIGQSFPVGGNLSYQLKLAYHSDVWDVWKEDLCPLQPEPCWHITTTPGVLSNAGFGFMLNLGALLAGTNPTSAAGWRFIDPSGAEHMFHETLHDGETAYSGYGYSRDGSYMRWSISAPYRIVEMPDGTKYSFEEYDTVAHKWRLFKIEDTYGNTVQIAYDTAPGGHPRWTISDSTGRSHTVLFDAAHKHVTSVTLAAFGGTTAQYTFTYAWPQVHRPCLTNDTNTSEYLNVPEVTPGATNTIPFLTAITLPDTSAYTMLDGSTPTYYTCCLGCAWTTPPHLCGTGTDGGTMAPGVLKKLRLPTGGAIAWSFQDNSYVWEEATRCQFDVICGRPSFLVWPGVQRRDLLDAAGVSISAWTYTYGVTANYGPSSNCPSQAENPGWRPEERSMVVKAPDGNATIHYFRAYPGSNGYMKSTHKSDYGLPYTRRKSYPDCSEAACTPSEQNCEGPFLSVEHFTGDVALDDDGDTCIPADRQWDQDNYKWDCVSSKGPTRSVYRQYALDTTATATGFRHANRNLIAETTLYEDGKQATTTYTGDTGLGRFRTVTTGGTFDAGNTRTTFTNFTPGSGTYPASFVLPSRTSPWVINTFTEATVTENGQVSKTEACFNAPTGFLLGTRALKNTGTGGADPARHANDVVVRHSRDAGGNVTFEEYFGGDTASVGTGELCDLLINQLLSSSATYRIAHTYQFGSRRTSRYLESNGTPVSFYSLDLDIDQRTGLPAATYSASTGTKTQGDYVTGVRTQLVYDSMGRLTWEKPDSGHGAYVHHQYLKVGTCSGPAKVETCTKANGTTTECVDTASECWPVADSLTRSAAHFDVLGRLVGEYTKYTGTSWNQRLTVYDAMSRKTSVSEWQPSGTSGTNLRNAAFAFCGDHDWDGGTPDICDPFGRVLRITPPDGAAHDVLYRYTGVRLVERKQKVATAVGSETDSLTTEEYDRQGRLWKVTEPSGASGANVTTTYAHDVGNRLSGVSTTSGAVTQTRAFTYDNRGFLLSEQLPELGASGNGTAAYSKYDARGHARRKQDGLHDLAYTFDRAERLTQVAQADGSGNPSTPVLTTLAYAITNSGSNKRNGKLETATSANPDLTSASVVETYAYAGAGGRVSSRQTQVEGRAITQSFTWNDLGQLSWQQYPDDSAIADPVRKVINTYTQGLLTGVCEGGSPPACTTNYLTSISYHANLMPNVVTHANQTKVTYGKDPNDMLRPASIALQRVSGGTTLWQTGAYAYDGSGNVKQIGTVSPYETFVYDKVSRLTSGTIGAGGINRTQTVSYDAFGSVLSSATHHGSRSFTVNGAINRVTNFAFQYDAAGNQWQWQDGAQTFTGTFNRLNQLYRYVTTGVNHDYGFTVDGERTLDRDNTANTRALWIRDLTGKVLREYTRSSGGVWSWSKDYIYRNGLHVASITASATRHFALDHLGTLRRGTTTDATPVLDTALTRDFYPFGIEATAASGADRMRFTGHERDPHSASTINDDLDYMHARYYNPNVARFLSVDPGRDVDPKVPQAWNMYAYVRNNPIGKTDPDGRITMFFGALIGGGAEYGIQVVTNLAGGSGFRSFADVDGRKIAASAALGAVTSGLTGLKIAGQGLSLGTRALIAAASNLGEAQAHAAIDGEPLSPLQAGTSLVTGGGSELGGAAGQELARSLATGAVKKLENTARRLANIAADGRARPAQAGRAAAAASRAAEYGAGTVAQTAQEVARKAVDEALEKRDQ